MKNTMIELVVELEKLSESKPKNELVKQAKEGAFHDYRSKTVCGKSYFLEWVAWFGKNWQKLELPESDFKTMVRLGGEIKDGDYDEDCTIEDRKILAKELNDPKCEMDRKNKDFFAMGMGISKRKDKFGAVTYFA